MPRPTHYTEEPSQLSTMSGTAYLRVQGGGFVTRDMLEQTLDDLRRSPPGAVLVDLRAVAGYESSCLLSAREFLREAPRLGVERIAVVASSTVMRTASRMAAQGATVELETFEHERAAAQWLRAGMAGVVAPRTHTNSSASAAP